MTATLQNRDCRVRQPRSRNRRCLTTPQTTEEQRDRARKLLATEIAFIPNASFRRDDEEQPTLSPASQSPPTAEDGSRAWPRELPPHLARLGEAPLLTAEQERDLFRRMNYLKFQANVLRTTLEPEIPDIETMETAEQLLDEARSIRDRIVRANIRLVMSVIKKFVTPRNSFDEMLSDGLLALMKTVEKFDYSRGFRFCTYAYRALTSNTYRSLSERAKREIRCVPWSDTLFDVGDENAQSLPDEPPSESLRGAIARILGHLDPRERFVVCGRFALGSQGKARTFQSLADDLGLSKERVRQIERQALSRMHGLALEMGLDESLGFAFAQDNRESTSVTNLKEDES